MPSTISILKNTTNVFCPYELKIYNGKQKYIPILSTYKKEEKPKDRGRGFPAGHATSGFAFLSLYFVPKKKKYKIIGLMYGMVAGWTTGMYQVLRGRHFLSHTIVTMFLSWAIILILVKLVMSFIKRKRSHRSTFSHKNVIKE